MLLLSISIGLHWMVLQSAAWVGMLVTYSQKATLQEALAKTFDGKHPCKICKVVQNGKKSEKKQETIRPGKELDSFLLAVTAHLAFPVPHPSVFQFTDSAFARSEQPPLPPPRVA